MKQKNQLLTLPLLIAICINSTVGIGIFNLPTEFARVSNPIFSVISFIIAGIGMGTMALTFKNLSDSKENFSSGMVSFIKDGFDEYFSTIISFGYFINTLIAFVAFFALFTKTFDSIINNANNNTNPMILFLTASIYLWTIVFIYLGGVKKVGILSILITLIKFIPIIIIFIFSIIHFNFDLFNVDNVKHILAGNNETTTIFSQLSKGIVKCIFCFLGIETLLNLIPNAKNKKDIGKGIVISVIIAILLYITTVILISSNISQNVLYNSKTPFATVLENSGIAFGSLIIKFTIMFSVMGSIFVWFLNVINFPYICAIDNIFPKFFLKRNNKDIPTNSLFLSTIFMQILLLLIFKMDLQNLYSSVGDIASTLSVMVYLITSIYGIKLFLTEKNISKLIIAIIATIFMIYALISVGINNILLSIISYIFAIPIFLKTASENNIKLTKENKNKIYLHLIITLICIIIFILK